MPSIVGTNNTDNIRETVSASTIRALAGDDVVVITGDENRLTAVGAMTS